MQIIKPDIIEHHARLAVIESQQNDLKESILEIKDDTSEILNKIQPLIDFQNQQRGFGAMLVLGAGVIGAAFTKIGSTVAAVLAK